MIVTQEGNQPKHICTREHPYTNRHDYPDGAIHPDAKFLFDEDWGDTCYDHYECPICGLHFSVEVAQ